MRTRFFHHSFDRSESSSRDKTVSSTVGEKGNGEESREGDVIVSSLLNQVTEFEGEGEGGGEVADEELRIN
jgi:hypothetical protein